jgi:hypothetical protein
MNDPRLGADARPEWADDLADYYDYPHDEAMAALQPMPRSRFRRWLDYLAEHPWRSWRIG